MLISRKFMKDINPNIQMLYLGHWARFVVYWFGKKKKFILI